MVDDTHIEEVESLTRGYTSHFNVNELHGNIRISGYFDDLNPDPEREQIDNDLDRIRREIDWNDALSFDYNSLSDIERRYGHYFLEIRF